MQLVKGRENRERKLGLENRKFDKNWMNIMRKRTWQL